MDIYTDHKVDFSVGVWCRAHKFNLTAIKLTRALQAHAGIVKAIRDAEAQLEKVEQQIRDLNQEIIEKIGD